MEILEAVEAEPADDICKGKRLSLQNAKNNLKQIYKKKKKIMKQIYGYYWLKKAPVSLDLASSNLKIIAGVVGLAICVTLLTIA